MAVLIRHPLTLVTEHVPAIPLNRSRCCLLLQDVHAALTSPVDGWLAQRARAKVLSREFAEFEGALKIMRTNLGRLTSAVRPCGIPVVYSSLGFTPPAQPSAFQRATGWTWDLSSPDGTFDPAWQPVPGEFQFSKPGWGALANPDFEAYLQRMGIETVIVAGSLFEFGIRQTCGELADRGYQPLVITDAVAALTQAGSVVRGQMAHGLTKLRSTGELLDLLEQVRAGEAVWV